LISFALRVSLCLLHRFTPGLLGNRTSQTEGRMRTILAFSLAVLLVAPLAAGQTPLLRYTFDEATSGTQNATDSGTAPLADGTLVSNATRTTNTPGGSGSGNIAALDLTGTNPKAVNAGDVDKLDGLTKLTLTSWINLSGSPANGNRIMAKQFTTSANFDGFSFAFSNPSNGAANISASNFQLNLALGGTNGFAFSTTGVDMGASNTWVFVAVTYDGSASTGNLQFYSGTPAGAVATLGTLKDAAAGPLVANANEFHVGASSASTTSAPIRLDDTRVYGDVLSLSQLESVRQEGLVPEPTAAGLLLIGTGYLAVRRPRRVA
jgi:hypothetical protein